MKIIVINGSPRKSKNTATLLQNALEGAQSLGAETELVHLYQLNYKGCTSCFACKRKGGKSYGTCACSDELTPVLKKIQQADAIIMGSPIYLCDVTGQMRSFLERLLFPYISYTEGYKSLFDRKIHTGMIYTMNMTAERLAQSGIQPTLDMIDFYLKKAFGHCESMYAFDTYQFDDYANYVMTIYDEHHKAQVRDEQFPKDCGKAFDMGRRFAKLCSTV